MDLTRLAAIAGRLAERSGRTIATAESCTGGLIAATCTTVAGSSAWFHCAFVTYSVAAKSRLLGVDAGLAAHHGVVSEPVARAMASGALDRCDASIAVAVTGVAGPGGGDVDLPVGTVWFAWADRGDPGYIRTARHTFDGDRDHVRQAATATALEGLVALLE